MVIYNSRSVTDEVTPRKRRVSRNVWEHWRELNGEVTPRKRRVSRNPRMPACSDLNIVTPRKRRVSRNDVTVPSDTKFKSRLVRGV